MIDGKIYSISSSQTKDIYIGSTTRPLMKRLIDHKSKYTRWIKGLNKGYCSSYKLLCYDDAVINLIKEFPCNNSTELAKLEGEYQKKIECVNMIIAGRTSQEYYQDNRDMCLLNNKKWKTENKEYRREYMTDYNKQYWDKNKEHLKEQNRLKYIRHREELLKKINCECGSVYSKATKSQHFKTKKHTKYFDMFNNLN
jgi:hypothetical protein